eukprot:1932735-Rhodomonas_salina.4
MLSSNYLLELQAKQLQLNLLSQMQPSFANLQRCNSNLDTSALQSWPSLDLASLVGGAVHQKTTFNINGQENTPLYVPAMAPRNTLSFPSLTGSAFSPTNTTSTTAASMLAEFLSASQACNKTAAPWFAANQQAEAKGLADTLKALNAELQQQSFAPAQNSFNFVLNSGYQPAQSTDENIDTEAEDGADTNSHDDDVDIEGSEADVTIFPRRKQGQDKLGRNRPAIKITRPVLEQLFNIPQKQACKRLGICATVMKRVCRKLGVHKWPYKESMARKQGHMLNRIMAQSS